MATRQISKMEIDFSGDFDGIPDFNRKALEKFMESFIQKYGDESEIFEISVYVKKFDSSYFGKPLVFCNFAANTSYGLVSTNMVDWGLKKAVRGCLKSLVFEINRLAERELYGEYAEIPA
ncbi:hypothetical protein J4216_00175 [Candidatus Woesearchaeota archaeon]|nr:hypothetical protein [Candidatus Woesearchaeota archaeon]